MSDGYSERYIRNEWADRSIATPLCVALYLFQAKNMSDTYVWYIYIRYNLMWLIGSDTISFESSHKNSLLVLSFKLEDTYSYFLTFRIHSLLLHSNNACSFLLNIPLVCISISRIVLRWKCKTVRFLITSQCFEHKSWCNIM